MPEIVLISGIPGTGENRKAGTKYPNHVLCEAGMFFDTYNGYKYENSKLKDVHEYCFNEARNALMIGLNAVVAKTSTCILEV